MKRAILLLAALLAGHAAAAQPVARNADEWGRVTPERAEVLKLSGDVKRGQAAFRICRGCHRSDAAGVPDGAYPRLTGQHASVLIKQITDVRAGVRLNPRMEPFADDHALEIQEIADIAVYVAQLTSTRENGKGPGDRTERGRNVYADSGCVPCHGSRGEGDAAKVYPAVAAQHYAYLLREMQQIKASSRGNSHPDMVRALSLISDADMAAVADFLSRLPDYRQAR